ncbi:hypothetical protein BGW36DRAFT_397510 [Talaromyces proteolyticus]|uniref:Uncharacterized protein n=1 Tax=Talaromyces proteolyticus TaxID=1131652 RepID=A0AAD4Q154_9EURO|nr:uncharacterized protein BGW36DRAFT_397510 [Talaromyces proteolyticus]KAH8697893.1 hypothetical protein BGW36DRAFT_397510 [Talaromyces proteolyticus]
MTELLQTHRRGVTLTIFTIQMIPPTCSSAYKNVPKTHVHQTVSLKPSITANMEYQAPQQIDHILDSIHSLDDLSADDVVELVGNNIRGVEYNAQNAYITLKGGPRWMHEAARPLEDRMSAATGSFYFLTGSVDCSLVEKFSGSTKQADASFMKSGSKWPVVILEVGISEPTNKLFENARRWLEGSDSKIKLVILVDVQETEKRNTLHDKWDLSETDFQETSHDRLSDKILQWYRSKEIRLVGSFKLSVHLWYSDGYRQCILDKGMFSPDNMIDLTTIEDIPLRLKHLMRLVHTLQNGFENVEISRASDLAKYKQKKYLSH